MASWKTKMKHHGGGPGMGGGGHPVPQRKGSAEEGEIMSSPKTAPLHGGGGGLGLRSLTEEGEIGTPNSQGGGSGGSPPLRGIGGGGSYGPASEHGHHRHHHRGSGHEWDRDRGGTGPPQSAGGPSGPPGSYASLGDGPPGPPSGLPGVGGSAGGPHGLRRRAPSGSHPPLGGPGSHESDRDSRPPWHREPGPDGPPHMNGPLSGPSRGGPSGSGGGPPFPDRDGPVGGGPHYGPGSGDTDRYGPASGPSCGPGPAHWDGPGHPPWDRDGPVTGGQGGPGPGGASGPGWDRDRDWPPGPGPGPPDRGGPGPPWDGPGPVSGPGPGLGPGGPPGRFDHHHHGPPVGVGRGRDGLPRGVPGGPRGSAGGLPVPGGPGVSRLTKAQEKARNRELREREMLSIYGRGPPGGAGPPDRGPSGPVNSGGPGGPIPEGPLTSHSMPPRGHHHRGSKGVGPLGGPPPQGDGGSRDYYGPAATQGTGPGDGPGRGGGRRGKNAGVNVVGGESSIYGPLSRDRERSGSFNDERRGPSGLPGGSEFVSPRRKHFGTEPRVYSDSAPADRRRHPQSPLKKKKDLSSLSGSFPKPPILGGGPDEGSTSSSTPPRKHSFSSPAPPLRHQLSHHSRDEKERGQPQHLSNLGVHGKGCSPVERDLQKDVPATHGGSPSANDCAISSSNKSPHLQQVKNESDSGLPQQQQISVDVCLPEQPAPPAKAFQKGFTDDTSVGNIVTSSRMKSPVAGIPSGKKKDEDRQRGECKANSIPPKLLSSAQRNTEGTRPVTELPHEEKPKGEEKEKKPRLLFSKQRPQMQQPGKKKAGGECKEAADKSTKTSAEHGKKTQSTKEKKSTSAKGAKSTGGAMSSKESGKKPTTSSHDKSGSSSAELVSAMTSSPLTCASLGNGEKVQRAERAVHRLSEIVQLSPGDTSPTISQSSHGSILLPTKQQILKGISGLDSRIQDRQADKDRVKAEIKKAARDEKLERERERLRKEAEERKIAEEKAAAERERIELDKKERERREKEAREREKHAIEKRELIGKLEAQYDAEKKNRAAKDDHRKEEAEEAKKESVSSLQSERLRRRCDEAARIESSREEKRRDAFGGEDAEDVIAKAVRIAKEATEAAKDLRTKASELAAAALATREAAAAEKKLADEFGTNGTEGVKGDIIDKFQSEANPGDIVASILASNRQIASEAHRDALSFIPEFSDASRISLPSSGSIRKRTNKEWSAMTRRVTGTHDALYSEPAENPFFKNNSRKHRRIGALVREHVRAKKRRLMHRIELLCEEHVVRREIFNDKADTERERSSEHCVNGSSERRFSTNSSSDHGGSSSGEYGGVGIRSSSNPYRRPRRGVGAFGPSSSQSGGVGTSDIVRSEYEQEQIIAELTAKEAMERRIACGGCTPPRQKLKIEYELFSSYRDSQVNRLIADPYLDEEERKNVNPWTDVEKCIFFDRFLHHPKDFRKIASFLRNKSTRDCVAFYYNSKQSVPYKAALREFHQRKKRRSDVTWEATIQAALSLGAVITEGTGPEKPLVFSLPLDDNTYHSRHFHPMKREIFDAVLGEDNEEEDIRTSPTKQGGPKNLFLLDSSERTYLRRSVSQDSLSGTKRKAEEAQGASSKFARSPGSSSMLDIGRPKGENSGSNIALAMRKAPQKWSALEKKIFFETVEKHGKNWALLETAIGTKSISQIKNYYYDHKKMIGRQRSEDNMKPVKDKSDEKIATRPVLNGTKVVKQVNKAKGGGGKVSGSESNHDSHEDLEASNQKDSSFDSCEVAPSAFASQKADSGVATVTPSVSREPAENGMASPVYEQQRARLAANDDPESMEEIDFSGVSQNNHGIAKKQEPLSVSMQQQQQQQHLPQQQHTAHVAPQASHNVLANQSCLSHPQDVSNLSSTATTSWLTAAQVARAQAVAIQQQQQQQQQEVALREWVENGGTSRISAAQIPAQLQSILAQRLSSHHHSGFSPSHLGALAGLIGMSQTSLTGINNSSIRASQPENERSLQAHVGPGVMGFAPSNSSISGTTGHQLLSANMAQGGTPPPSAGLGLLARATKSHEDQTRS